MADLVHAHTSGRVKGLRMGQPAPLLDLRFHCGPKLMQAHITPILTESVWAASPIWKTASCMIVSAYNYLWLVALLCPVLLWFTFHLLWYLAIMRPTPTPPSTPVLYSGCLKCQEVTVTKVRGSDTSQEWATHTSRVLRSQNRSLVMTGTGHGNLSTYQPTKSNLISPHGPKKNRNRKSAL